MPTLELPHSPCCGFPRSACLAMVLAVMTACLVATAADPTAKKAEKPEATSRAPTVPPVPQGTPAELLAYIEKLADPATMPTSRGRLRYYLRKAAAATAEAADRILAQTDPETPLYERAVALELDALLTLERLGEPQAAEALAAFAGSLGEVRNADLAARVQQASLTARINVAVASGRPEDAAPLIARFGTMLEADPDNLALATTATDFAMQIAGMPDGEPMAAAAFRAFLPRLEASGNPAIRGLAEQVGGTARRLTLPGNPMRIRGTLLSGEPFDQSTLAGKVVLVDFWATWCGPCVAEIANLRKEYARWHDKGFEVVGVSLDEDREILEQFVAAKDVPWPILYEEPVGVGWKHPLASYYGITGIPTVVLIGRDGNVVTLDARGKKLAAALERLLGKPTANTGLRR